jgi:hypothetical protein
MCLGVLLAQGRAFAIHFRYGVVISFVVHNVKEFDEGPTDSEK